jgi:hypothetical protein
LDSDILSQVYAKYHIRYFRVADWLRISFVQIARGWRFSEHEWWMRCINQ